MKATFPYFGYDTVALKGFLEDLGATVILPPPNTKRTLELGVKHSPELICLPFKITLGNFIEALKAGADTLFMAAGARKCRFGYYHYLQEEIVKKFKREVSFYGISQYSFYQFIFKKMPEIFNIKPRRVLRAFYRLLKKSELINDFTNRLRNARVLDFGLSEKVERRGLRMIESAKTVKEMNHIKKQLKILFPTNGAKPQPVKIGLVGEIYFMIEPFANHNIEKELARLGALVISRRSLYHHLKHLLKLDISYLKYAYLARPYLRDSPGGEAIKTVGEAVEFAKNGVSGIIHIFPFTCMPENIAQEALQRISEDYNLPVISLSFDEHTSETGFLTRLEAFVDLLKRRKNKTHL